MDPTLGDMNPIHTHAANHLMVGFEKGPLPHLQPKSLLLSCNLIIKIDYNLELQQMIIYLFTLQSLRLPTSAAVYPTLHIARWKIHIYLAIPKATYLSCCIPYPTHCSLEGSYLPCSPTAAVNSTLCT
jgi:hypothetical protein